MRDRAQDRYVPNTNAPLFSENWSPSETELKLGDPVARSETYAKLKELAATTAQTDYTGMSPDEIFADIWNRYDEAFDGNMVAVTACIAGPIEWERINNHFLNEVHHYANISGRDRYWKVLGYDGMNYDEMEAAIKEKYTGRNTPLDFLKMQSELRQTGILEHRMGQNAGFYCALMRIQFEHAFNPDFLKQDGLDVNLHISTEQWNRVANQPFDAAKLAAGMKEQLGRIRTVNGFTDDFVRTMEECIDLFVKGVIDDSLDQMLGGAKK